MYVLSLFLLSWLILQCTSSHFVSFKQQFPQSNKVCEGPSNTSLVEQFFNLIFSEFHSSPPVCVCVQMCPDHPTYCYPNGCFKKAEPPIKKFQDATATVKYQPTAQVSQLQQDDTQPMSFLVDGQNSYVDGLMGFNSIDAKPVSKIEDSTISQFYKEMHRDPFKDRYQSIFKYKKTPKVHLRYNLREQVKHKKTDVIKIDKIDIAKTRWPLGDDKNRYLENAIEHKDNKYFHNLEHENTHYPTKYFKRDVTKLFENKKGNNLVEEVENVTENVQFSLENLIENLIESSFGPLTNDTELDLNVNLDYSVDSNVTTMESITVGPNKKRRGFVEKYLIDKNTIIVLNETTNVVSLNNTNQNTDANKYRDGDDAKDQMYKNVFNDMIASLSRNIEKNNNSSIEIMEQVLGHRIENASPNTETITIMSPEPLLTNEFLTNITTSMEAISENSVSVSTTEVSTKTLTQAIDIMSTEMEKEQINLMRKSHRRVLRKSHNNKPN